MFISHVTALSARHISILYILWRDLLRAPKIALQCGSKTEESHSNKNLNRIILYKDFSKWNI